MGYLQHLGQQYQLIEQRLNIETENCGNNSTIIHIRPEVSTEESIYSQKTDETVETEVKLMSPSGEEKYTSPNSQKSTTNKSNKEIQEANIVVIRAKNQEEKCK